MDIKSILGLGAVLMTVWAHIPYLRHTLSGANKPHIFTWIIWTLLTGVAFAAQIAGNGGAGAWVTGVTCVICAVIALAALRSGEKNITRSDWVMFLFGLAAIPVWLVTSDPLWSVWMITIIDISAVYPTFRKSWRRPHEENSFMYGFNIPRHIMSIMALSHISVVTALYPFGLLLMNVAMYAMLKTRRLYLARTT